MLNDNFPDYEIWIKTSSNSAYKIIYDHILDLNVITGDKINAGDIIGKVGDKNRTELQINKTEKNRKELSYCPFDFGTNEFISLHKSFTEIWCLSDIVVP